MTAASWLTSPRVTAWLKRCWEEDQALFAADRAALLAEARERAALIAIPDSILAKRGCVTCGKGENEVPITEMAKRQRQCDDCYAEQLEVVRQEERDVYRMGPRYIGFSR